MTDILANLDRLRLFALHVRNCCELGPHPLRAEGVEAYNIVESVKIEVERLLAEADGVEKEQTK